MSKQKFYYTFGSDGQPYEGGWVEIYAEDFNEADKLFRKRYGDGVGGFIRCAGRYTEAMFKNTGMYEHGNMGNFCHDTLGGE
jgi:hypothetical protein